MTSNHRGEPPSDTEVRPPRKAVRKVWTWLAVFGLLASFFNAVQPTAAQAYVGDDGMTVTIGPDSIVQGSGAAFTMSIRDTNRSKQEFNAYFLSGLEAGWTVFNAGIPVAAVLTDPIVFELPKADAQNGKITIKPPLDFQGNLNNITVARIEVIDLDQPTAEPSDSTSADPADIASTAPATGAVDANGAPLEGMDAILANLAIEGDTAVSDAPSTQWWWCHCCCIIHKCCCCCCVLKCTDSLAITKTSDPITGSIVTAGQRVTYTLTAKNNGGALSNVNIVDDMSDVLDNAQLSGTPTATLKLLLITKTATAPTISGTTLTWTGSLSKGQSVTITYSVIVNSGLQLGDAVVNHVTGWGTGAKSNQVWSNCVTGFEPGCTSTLTPGISGLTVKKISNPPSGSTVLPGQLVNYTLTALNTGNVSLSPVTLTDDLSDVLDNATIAGAFNASINGRSVGGVTLTGTTLNWQGALSAGQTVTVSYSVVVKPGTAANDMLKNRVVAAATSGNGAAPTNCVTGLEDGCYSILNPGVSSINVSKVSNPVTGSIVNPGQTITYTITAVNQGNTTINNAALSDNLSGVLDSATFDPSSLQMLINGQQATPAAQLLGSTVTWIGNLPPRATAVMTYKVTVNQTVAANSTLVNRVNTSGNPNVPSNCVTGLEDGCYSILHSSSPNLEVAKTSVPESGSQVQGDAPVTYTLTASNTGNVDLNPVTLTDDLSEVLANAQLDRSTLKATIGDTQVVAPVLSGTTLTWIGSLAVGQTVTVTYQVNIGPNIVATGAVSNHVIGAAVNPANPNQLVPSTCVTGNEPQCTSSIFPLNPGLHVTKTSNPSTGGNVVYGEIITYTLTAQNTGNTDLAGVTLVDDMSEVLTSADILTDTWTVKIDGVDAGPAPEFTDSTLTWNGALAVGQTAVVTYQVEINVPVVPVASLVNRVTANASIDGVTRSVIPSNCVTGNETECKSVLTYEYQMPTFTFWNWNFGLNFWNR